MPDRPVRFCTPPVPVVVEKMLVQFALSVDTWIWNAVAYAVSQFRVTPQMLCAGAEVDLQPLRVGERARPAGAGVPVHRGAAGMPAFSVEEAVAVLFSATLVVPQVAADALGAVAPKRGDQDRHDEGGDSQQAQPPCGRRRVARFRESS